MSGGRYLLDTNAVIALLQGNDKVIEILKPAEWIGISVITQIEFLVFPDMSSQDKILFDKFLKKVSVAELAGNQTELFEYIADIRQKYRIKLPDAIIAGTAICKRAALITSDLHLQRIRNLSVINFLINSGCPQ